MSSTYTVEKLIETVRTHTPLYDIFSIDYNDQNFRKEAWQEIGEKLQMPAEKCKSDWTKLRNCFLNSIRRRRENKTSGQSANHIPPWKFSQQMEFLLPFLKNQETHSNIEVHNQDESPKEMPDMKNDTSSSLPGSQKDQLADNELNHSLLTTQKGPIKRKNSNNNEEMMEIMRLNATLRKENYEKRAYNMNHDEVELFYLSMAKIAKRLPKVKEAKLRMDVCNKVSEAELAHLLEVETIQRQPQELNRNQISSHQKVINYLNQSSLFQPPISRSFVEESICGFSPSTYSNHSNQ